VETIRGSAGTVKIATFLAATLLLLPRATASEEAKELLKVSAVEARAEPAAPASPAEGGEKEPTVDQPAANPPAEEEAPVAAEPEQIVPEAYPVERYAVLWENSPFQTESVAPPVESPGLAQRFSLSGILRENGEYLVWVRERATQQSYMVSKNGPNVIGLSLVEVAESPERQSEASATVRLGGEIGVIKFDAVAAPGAPPPPMAMPQPVPQPGVRAFPQPPRAAPQVPPVAAAQTGYPGAMPVPGQPGVPAVIAPGVVPPVPGPGIPAPPGQAQVAPGQEQMPPPRVIRRRAIVPSAP